MAYKLLIEDYGKIKRAEIEITPLTLFVGDNNSGKSYLLSLIWAVLSERENNIILNGLKELLIEQYSGFYHDITRLVKMEVPLGNEEKIIVNENEIIDIINSSLELTKDRLVKSLFNYEGMSIGKIEIEPIEKREFILTQKLDAKDRTRIDIKLGNEREMGFIYSQDGNIQELVAVDIIKSIAEFILNERVGVPNYLPAARTGFMLAKNTINQVGRKKTFDYLIDADVGLDLQVSPFPKTIIHFLDAIDNLDLKNENENSLEIVKWIEENMVNGDIECEENSSGNIQYIPRGKKEGIPLRATSGVVTELTPLVLLLKYSNRLSWLCYEEPEMCLHPQLQLKMAELLIHMVNNGINLVATTHSDIIIQHINNMCQLSGHFNEENIDSISLKWDDLIEANKVSIYQFNDEGDSSTVERITPNENVFTVKSFTKALQSILEKTLSISELIHDEEE